MLSCHQGNGLGWPERKLPSQSSRDSPSLSSLFQVDQLWFLLIPEWRVSPLLACRTTPTAHLPPGPGHSLLRHSLLPQPRCAAPGSPVSAVRVHCPCGLDRGLLLRTWTEQRPSAGGGVTGKEPGLWMVLAASQTSVGAGCVFTLIHHELEN